MVDSNNEIAVIDFQDLCIGPVGIDLAGIIVDHYISYSDELINNIKFYQSSKQIAKRKKKKPIGERAYTTYKR